MVFTKNNKKRMSVLLSSVMLASYLNVNMINESTAETIYPQDTVKIKKISDGTHGKRGEESFINAKNGFSPGDDDDNDGIVTSGDYVRYSYKLSFAPGPEREIKVDFSQNGQGLELGDLENISLNNSIVESSYENHQWKYIVPKGAALNLEGVIALKAKDTKGLCIKDNVLNVKLSNQDYSYKTKSEPVTVISSPFADLTIKTEKEIYSQNDTEATFTISPTKLHIQGYSDNGLIASSEWITDVDVTEFPKDAVWFFEGSKVQVENGIIKNLKGEGEKQLKYQLTNKEEIPKNENTKAKVYTAHIIPHRDSFKVGNTLNIEDIGKNEDKNYDTSKFTLNGKSVGAVSGQNNPNNNYATHTWRYHQADDGKLLGHRLFAPRNYAKTIFEKSNIYFDDTKAYYEQGSPIKGIEDAEKLTQDNDLYSYIRANLSVIDKSNDGKVIIGDTINDKGIKGDYRAIRFDNTKMPCVKINEKIISPDDYIIQYRHVKEGITSLDDDIDDATKWITSNKAPNNKVNQIRIIFKKGKLPLNQQKKDLYVFVPLKTLKNYDATLDNGKLINATASLVINEKEIDTQNPIVKQKTENLYSVGNNLSFPKVPKITALVSTNKTKPQMDSKKGVFNVKFGLYDYLTDASSSENYKVKRVLTFDDVYNVDTFMMTKASGYEFKKTGPHEITLTNNKASLNLDTNDNTWSIGDVIFAIDTVYALSEKDINAKLTEKTYVTYPEIGNVKSDTIEAKAQNAYTFDGAKIVSSTIEAKNHKTEIESPLTFTVKVSTANTGFSQDIILPHNGDYKTYIPKINKTNNSNIKINEDTGLDENGYMDGIGRSRFSGNYKINGIKLKDFSSDTKVEITIKGKTYKLPVLKDGSVDLTQIKDIETDGSYFGKADRINISSPKRMSDIQNGGFTCDISILPVEPNTNNDYVINLNKTLSYDKKSTIGEKIPWPEYIKTVASSISGSVFSDENMNYKKDKEETGFALVNVKLLKKENGSFIETKHRTQTDVGGNYSFTGLKSGEYKVVLPNVERSGKTDANIIAVNNKKDEGAYEGTLPLGKKNRFGVYENTRQTISYDKMNNASESTANISIDTDENIENVNFGYFIPNKDLKLDKHEAKIEDLGDKTKVTWEIEIQNSGNDFIKDVKLTDVVSDKLKNVKSSLGYQKIEKKEPMRLISACGRVTNMAVGTSDGLYITNKDGSMYKVNGLPSSIKRIEGNLPEYQTIVETEEGIYSVYRKNEVYKLKEITGEIITIGSDLLGNEFAIVTTDGYFFTREKGKVEKVNGTEGKIIGTTKNRLGYQEGIGVLTTKGYYFIQNRSCEKIDGIKGEMKYVTGDNPEDKNYSSAVLTSDGYFFVKDNKVVKSLKNIPKGVKFLIGYDPYDFGGSAIATKDEYYLIYDDGYIRKINNISGEIVSISGYWPTGKPKNGTGGSLVGTTEGCYYVDYNGKVSKIKGIEGKITSVECTEPLYDGFVLTTKGVYRIKNDKQAEKIEEIKGNVKEHKFANINLTGTIVTTEGAFVTKIKNNEVTKIMSPDLTTMKKEYVKEENISPDEQENLKGFTKREYTLPLIGPNDTTILQIEGYVIKREKPEILVNQAYATSDKTPREKVNKLASKEPTMPNVPNISDYNPKGLKLDNTSYYNESINDDSSPNGDDLADQNPVITPASSNTSEVEDAKVSGYAWIDKNEDGLRNDNAPAEKIIVSLIDKDTNLVWDTKTTDDKGFWELTGICGKKYDIYYDIVNYDKDGKNYKTTVKGKNKRKDDSDVSSNGYVENPSELKRINEQGDYDCGLIEIESKIKVIKGPIGERKKDDKIYANSPLTNEDESKSLSSDNLTVDDTLTASGKVDDKDNNPKTQAYRIVFGNFGKSDLTSIKISDETIKGNKAKLPSNYKVIRDGSLESSYMVTVKNGILKHDNEELILHPGDRVIGVIDIGFTKNNPVHENELKVSANIVVNDKVIGSTQSSDTMKVEYIHRSDKRLKVTKVGVDSIEEGIQKEQKRLENVEFKMYKIDNFKDTKAIDKMKSETIGDFITDENGCFDLSLPEGTYRIVEKKTTNGYMKPDGDGWFVTVEYDENEKPNIRIYADAKMPYSEIIVSKDNKSWGEVKLYNYKRLNVPLTGGNMKIFMLGGIAMLLLGSIVFTIRKKD